MGIAYLGPVLAVGFGLFWLFAGRRMMSSTNRRYKQYRLDELAQRLGLHIVEGDPTLNMVQAHTVDNMRGKATKVGGRVRQALGDQVKETKVLLQGAPYGRPTTFLFHSYDEYSERIVVGINRHFFDCRFSLQIPVDLPPFEIVGRTSLGARYMGLKAKPEWDLPAQSFGDRDLDAKFTLTTPDPRLGPYLAPVVGALAGHKYVHIQGNKDVIQSRATEEAYMHTVFDIENTQRVLEHMATALAGPVQR